MREGRDRERQGETQTEGREGGTMREGRDRERQGETQREGKGGL